MNATVGFGSGGGRRSVLVCPLLAGPLDGGGSDGTLDGRGNLEGAFGNLDGALGGEGTRDFPVDGDVPGGRTVERPEILAVFPFSSSFFAAIRRLELGRLRENRPF